MYFGDYDYINRKEKVEEILRNTDQVKEVNKFPKDDSFTYTNGYKAWATAIFVDIRESTRLFSTETKEEEITAAKVVRGFTSEVIEILNQNTNNQLEEIGVRGDCVYAIYSTPNQSDIYDVVVRGAYINTYMRMYNKLLEQYSLPTIKVGIGISSAETVAVKAGRKSSGINGIVWIGSAVSIASKLSNVTNRYPIKAIGLNGIAYSNIIEYTKNTFDNDYDFSSYFESKWDSYIGTFYHGDIVFTDFSDWIHSGMK